MLETSTVNKVKCWNILVIKGCYSSPKKQNFVNNMAN